MEVTGLLLDPIFENAWRLANAPAGPDLESYPPDLYRFYNLADTGRVIHGSKTSTGDLREYSGDNASSYFSDIVENPERIINYFNPLDIALEGWELNQAAKPSLAERYYYQNSGYCYLLFVIRTHGGL